MKIKSLSRCSCYLVQLKVIPVIWFLKLFQKKTILGPLQPISYCLLIA